MKRISIIMGLILTLFALNSNAQPTVRIKWQQIIGGQPGQIAYVGTNNIGQWVTPPFLNIADTADMLAAYQSQINQRVKYSDTTSMLQPYRSGISSSVKYSDTANMLSPYNTAINARVKYTDTAAMLAALWSEIATKANDNAVIKTTGAQSKSGVLTFTTSPIVPTPTSNTQAANKKYVDDLGTSVSNTYIPLSQKGANNGVATLDGAGKIPQGQLPAITITNTFSVATQAAMLALNATQGDVAVRTDLNKSFILRQEPASSFANWNELLSPTVSNTDQIPEGSTNLYFTTERARQAISAGSGLGYNPTTGVMTNSSPNLPSNLAIGTRTNTAVPITNSDGTGFTFPAATSTLAGAMTGTEKTKLNGIEAGAQANVPETDPIYTADEPTIFKVRGTVSPGDDYNDYIEPGSFNIATLTGPTLINNIPLAGNYAAVLRVTATNVTSMLQEVYITTSGSSDKSYYRTRVAQTWSPWRQVALADQIVGTDLGTTNQNGEITSSTGSGITLSGIDNRVDKISAGDALGRGLTAFYSAPGSTGYPAAAGGGIRYERGSGTLLTSFEFWKQNSINNTELYYSVGLTIDSMSSYYRVASKEYAEARFSSLKNDSRKFTGSTSNTKTLPNAPSAEGINQVFLNGVLIDPVDFSISGTNIVFASNITLETDDVVIVYYQYQP